MDILVDQGLTLIPIEIKAGQTINADYFSGLRRWLAWAGSEAGQPYLIYGGDESQRRQHADVVPWRQLAKVAEECCWPPTLGGPSLFLSSSGLVPP